MLTQLCWQPCSRSTHMSTPARQNGHQWHSRHMGTQLWLTPCPCSRSQRDHPHSPSPAHPLIPSAQTLCSALSWHLTGEAAAPSALLLARAATPSTSLG